MGAPYEGSTATAAVSAGIMERMQKMGSVAVPRMFRNRHRLDPIISTLRQRSISSSSRRGRCGSTLQRGSVALIASMLAVAASVSAYGIVGTAKLRFGSSSSSSSAAAHSSSSSSRSKRGKKEIEPHHHIISSSIAGMTGIVVGFPLGKFVTMHNAQSCARLE